MPGNISNNRQEGKASIQYTPMAHRIVCFILSFNHSDWKNQIWVYKKMITNGFQPKPIVSTR